MKCEKKKCKRLILLVGSNPLPNYIAAAVLKPNHIDLVYSADTEYPKKRLAEALAKELGAYTQINHDVFINDPASAKEISYKISELMSNIDREATHLHYTGGTKVMSAHALKAFYCHDGKAENASYLDEKRALLRFDNGEDCELNVSLKLELILQLHHVLANPRSNSENGPRVSDAKAIAEAVCQRPRLADCLYKERQRLECLGKPKAARPCPFDPSAYGLTLSIEAIPADDKVSKKSFVAWYKFIGGEWLEEWIAEKIISLGLADITRESVLTGVNGKRQDSGRPFEVDIAIVRGHRSYFISCTTDTSLRLCKSKAFEIATRSRQMGGDLARSALISLLMGEDQNGQFVKQLQDDVADVWGATNTTKVFGLEDVRTWAGHYGTPNPESLREWFES